MTDPFPIDLQNIITSKLLDTVFHTICFVGGGSVENGATRCQDELGEQPVRRSSRIRKCNEELQDHSQLVYLPGVHEIGTTGFVVKYKSCKK